MPRVFSLNGFRLSLMLDDALLVLAPCVFGLFAVVFSFVFSSVESITQIMNFAWRRCHWAPLYTDFGRALDFTVVAVFLPFFSFFKS